MRVRSFLHQVFADSTSSSSSSASSERLSTDSFTITTASGSAGAEISTDITSGTACMQDNLLFIGAFLCGSLSDFFS